MQSAFFDMTDPRTPQRDLVDQAVAWLVRLQSDQATEADRAGFDAWYAASDAHRDAYSEAKTFVNRLRRPALEVWDEQLLGRTSGTYGMVRRWVPATAFGVALAVALIFLWHAFSPQSPDVLKTAKGEHRRFQLADGSSVLLNSNTKVLVAFTGQRRGIELLAGEALFVVAKDPERPFEVTAGQGVTRALGTEFNVRLHQSAATVTVVEGVVQVSQQQDSGDAKPIASPVQVHPNETVSYSRHDGMGSVRHSDALTSLAWQRGQLVFNKKPLADVIEELNQQWDGHIFVAGPGLRQLPVNGVFDIHDAPSAVRAIERTFHVRSVTLPLNVIVLY